ncbi:hypothetical protein SARC_07995 [Sphaeroforma arctica JP610]|uniref:Poly A polymerase head domain-containing protein n=1 Tax=Sphaeroforma arctica JP610 TaxID=667725 RepID=A0A0L0FS96_9EUKA|nr:hypothetical protein SARC_07995 [Sphaeroforma arctica JP610]KNC79615.1 hypothetical protein SARC_07995 [Sphaeroforma arctica JP610]|eukprot:XP_014153517.1 hypothetical protein SARC_07995 [Sphaeroforma arctica JP610]
MWNRAPTVSNSCRLHEGIKSFKLFRAPYSAYTHVLTYSDKRRSYNTLIQPRISNLALIKHLHLGTSRKIRIYRTSSSINTVQIKHTTQRSVYTTRPPAMHPELDIKLFNSLLTPSVLSLHKHFTDEGYELRFVGGVVRDLFMGVTPKDVDLATTATPEEMVSVFTKYGYRYIPTGLQHGTLTVHTKCMIDYEITTLRIDKVTDGRHAEGASASVSLNGVGNEPADRKRKAVSVPMQSGKRVTHPGFSRIVSGPNAAAELTAFGPTRTNIGTYIDIPPAAFSPDRLVHLERVRMLTTQTQTQEHAQTQTQSTVVSASTNPNANPVTCLMTLLEDEAQFMLLVENYRMSKKEMNLGLFLSEKRDVIGYPMAVESVFSPQPLVDRESTNGIGENRGEIDQSLMFKQCTDLLVDGVAPELVVELCLYLEMPQIAHHVRTWEIRQFPINGKILAKEGNMQKGPALGHVLKELKNRWKASSYVLTSEKLLGQLPELLAEVDRLGLNVPPPSKGKKPKRKGPQ